MASQIRPGRASSFLDLPPEIQLKILELVSDTYDLTVVLDSLSVPKDQFIVPVSFATTTPYTEWTNMLYVCKALLPIAKEARSRAFTTFLSLSLTTSSLWIFRIETFVAPFPYDVLQSRVRILSMGDKHFMDHQLREICIALPCLEVIDNVSPWQTSRGRFIRSPEAEAAKFSYTLQPDYQQRLDNGDDDKTFFELQYWYSMINLRKQIIGVGYGHVRVCLQLRIYWEVDEGEEGPEPALMIMYKCTDTHEVTAIHRWTGSRSDFVRPSWSAYLGQVKNSRKIT